MDLTICQCQSKKVGTGYKHESKHVSFLGLSLVAGVSLKRVGRWNGGGGSSNRKKDVL